MSEEVYCTLLLNDAYLPGAQVLAHSLRDAGTTKRLAVMVFLNGCNRHTTNELKKTFDYVIPVEPHYSRSPQNLRLMKRIDLNIALTKIELWKQVQFKKVVYLDADMLALRAPDELFDVDAHFAASPDIGWPDCFNSGMMVVRPDLDTHQELVARAEKGETFDGADQGLLNQHFEDWHRLSFTYNCTVGTSMGYQYLPAMRHYGSKVSMVHFIGQNKPWNRYIPGLSSTDPYDKFSAHWWSVYNKHYAPSSSTNDSGAHFHANYPGGAGGSEGGPPAPKSGSDYTDRPNHSASSGHSSQTQNESQNSSAAGGAHDTTHQFSEAHESTQSEQVSCQHAMDSKSTPGQSSDHSGVYQENIQFETAPSADHPPHHTIAGDNSTGAPPSHYQNYITEGRLEEFVLTTSGPISQDRYFRTGAWTYCVQDCDPDGQPIVYTEPQTPNKQFTPWDPSRFSPPPHGPPEADQFVVQAYENEWDQKNRSSRPFIAPELAPPSSLHLWYDIPRPTSETEKVPSTKPIFPWEEKPRQVARVFHDESSSNNPVEEKIEEILHRDPAVSADNANVFNHHHLKPVFPWEQRPRTVFRVFAEDSVLSPPSENDYGDDEENINMSSQWGKFSTRENRWDADPAIRDYILALRRRKSETSSNAPLLPTPNPSDESLSSAPVMHMVQTEGPDEPDVERLGDIAIETGNSKYRDFAVQTEPLTLSHIGTQYGIPFGLADIGTQYGNPLRLSDSSTQYGSEGDMTDMLTADNDEEEEDEDYERFDDMLAPKTRAIELPNQYMTKRFGFDEDHDKRLIYDESIELPARKMFVIGRSIGSALGGAIIDEI